jgi:hypothetical protein
VSTTGEDLKQRCERVHSGLGQAIDWVEEVRSGAPRLERDCDGLVEKLRRSRNLCRRLGAAAMRPLSIGVFGMSQAGKSYLVSSLARSAQGHLFTQLEGHRFNFIGHINPPGGGKEATGLVTRFTRRASQAPPGYPVELTLFSEADLIKILGNSFFNDFDKERVSIESDPVRVREHLEKYARDQQARPTGGLDEDAMVDVMDYFEKRFARSMEPLRGDFWPTVIELAPRLPAQQRGGLLSLLWGEIPELTRAYVQLRDGLEKLSGVRTVYVPLDALVIGSGDDFRWNPDSIINRHVEPPRQGRSGAAARGAGGGRPAAARGRGGTFPVGDAHRGADVCALRRSGGGAAGARRPARLPRLPRPPACHQSRRGARAGRARGRRSGRAAAAARQGGLPVRALHR